MIYWLKLKKYLDEGYPGVVAYYSFDSFLSGNIKDDSGHGNDAVAVGNITATTTSKRKNALRMRVNTYINYPDENLGTTFEINFFARS